MKRPPFAVVGTVVLIVLASLAGCTGVSRLTHPGSATANELPPGVNESGVTNATALVDAHRATLADSGHAYRMRTNSTAASSGRNGAVASNSSLAVRIGGDSTYSVRVNQALASGPMAQNQSTWLWANDSIGLLRASAGERTVFRANASFAGTKASAPRRTATESEPRFLHEVLSTGNFSVANVDRSGDRTLVTLRADDVRSSANVSVESYNATVVVDSRGVVHHATMRAAVGGSRASSGRQTLRTTYDLTAQSVDHVERPAWSAKALENRTA